MEEHDDHVLTYYAYLAMALMMGRAVRARRGRKREYLSRHTKPSEGEARIALVILLNRIRKQLADERLQDVMLVLTLALIDDRDLGADLRRRHSLKLVPHRRSTGHSDPIRDRYIAAMVQFLRDGDKTREDAIGEVAQMFGRDERTIEKIYDREKKDGRLIRYDTASDS